MFDQIFIKAKILISGFLIGVTSLFGGQKLVPSQSPEQEILQEESSETIPIATVSATPTIKPKPSFTPPPTPEPKIDLNLEGISLLPEKIESKEDMEKNYEWVFWKPRTKI